jgi:hypothetical protein
LALSAGGLAAACAAGNDGNSKGRSASSSGEGGAGTGGAGTGGIAFGGSGGGTYIAEVYGHSADVLYKLDPVTKGVSPVGTFSGCGGGIIDLAIDKDHAMFGVTSQGLYAIDKTTAACSTIANGDYPNSLSFVPVGTLDPDEEALVGYLDAIYVRIDKQSGNVSEIGALSGGYESSGDIVSVIGGATYLTVRGSSCADCVVEIDPVTGDLTRNYGTVGHDEVFGLAFWGGSAYGFSNMGDLFEIHFQSTGVTTTPITIPNAPSDLQFWGAASSTDAPLVPPS